MNTIRKNQTLIFIFFFLIIILAFNSCKTCNCPAYTGLSGAPLKIVTTLQPLI